VNTIGHPHNAELARHSIGRIIVAMNPEHEREFWLLNRITLGVIGQSIARDLIQPVGSAFFIAPYTVLTAAHVIFALWDELQPPWLRGRYPEGDGLGAFCVALANVPDLDHPEVIARWRALSLTASAYADLAFLHVAPDNRAAEEFAWPAFPELMLLPPEVGVSVTTLGYPDVQIDELSERTTAVTLTPRYTSGDVLANWEQGRGSWLFPQFETSASFEHGMSGGPVLADGKLCGVVSYAARYEDGSYHSYAAALWPALLAGPVNSVDPCRSIPLVSMLETGALRSSGWRAVAARAIGATTCDGRNLAILREGAG
jgi:hypothetical protein